MKLTAPIRRLATIVCFLSLVYSSCGYDPNQPVYDYTLNPEGFPPEALTVLNEVEAATIDGYQGIITAFGALYSAQPALLDNANWQTVIQRLGAKFRYRADNLVLAGPDRFLQAADLYTLAAFARPNDKRSVEQRDLFDTWRQAVDDSLIRPSDWEPDKNPGLRTRLVAAKTFVLGDSLDGAFARKYLIPRLFFSGATLNMLNLQAHDSLTDGDRAFANYLGLNVRPPRSRLTTFSRPSIEFISAEITSAGPGMYRAALYFIPRQKIDSSLTVALRLKGADPTASGGGEINLDFLPQPPTSRWKVGKIQVAYRKFRFHSQATEVSVGLYESTGNEPRFVEIEGSSSRLFQLPSASLAVQ